MQLILFRHGEAGVARRDADRCLTDRGIAEVRRVACELAPELSAAVAYHSPYLRARQSCAEIARNTDLKTCDELNCITPDDDPMAVIHWLQQKSATHADSTVLLVSHQPLVSRLISLLVDGDEQGFYPMATASVTCLQADLWERGLARVSRVVHAADLE